MNVYYITNFKEENLADRSFGQGKTLAERINKIWQPQANITFTLKVETPITVDLDKDRIGIGSDEMKKVLEARRPKADQYDVYAIAKIAAGDDKFAATDESNSLHSSQRQFLLRRTDLGP